MLNVLAILALIWFGYALGRFIEIRSSIRQIDGFLIMDKSDEDVIKWILDIAIDPENLKEFDEVLLQVMEK